MGCDIHSLAEVRDQDGNWVKVGAMFPYPWSFARREWSMETIEKLPAEVRDGYLLDAVEHYVRNRDVPGMTENPDYYRPYFPEIEKNSTLAQKIIDFGQKISKAVEYGRSDEGRKLVDEKFSTYSDCHDPDGWARYLHTHKKMYGQEADLSEQERELLMRAILSHQVAAKHEDDETGDESTGTLWKLDLSFHIFHGPGWFARYREGQTPHTDKDAPEYLHDALPYWDDSFQWHDEPLDSRNYTLFGVIANVRNSNRDGQRVEPIAEPKGVPDDASPEYKKLVERWGVDGHSHTYLTLAEIKAYDFEGDVQYSGLVSEQQYEALIEEGYPEDPYVGPSSWAGGIGGAGIVTFTEDGYKKWVEIGRPYIRQPESVSFLAPDIHVSPEHLPDEPVDPSVASLQAAPAFQDRFNTTTMEQATAGKVDEAPGVSDEQIREGFQRYSYNGVKPYIEISWKQKRGKILGHEFREMVEIFEQIVAEREMTDDDVRLVAFFDN